MNELPSTESEFGRLEVVACIHRDGGRGCVEGMCVLLTGGGGLYPAVGPGWGCCCCCCCCCCLWTTGCAETFLEGSGGTSSYTGCSITKQKQPLLGKNFPSCVWAPGFRV